MFWVLVGLVDFFIVLTLIIATLHGSRDAPYFLGVLVGPPLILLVLRIIDWIQDLRDRNREKRIGYSGSGGSSKSQSAIGKYETDGYTYYSGPQRGVDYPSSWHDANTPGGSLDI